ncbi:MAG: MFS transporter [Candidatus Dojkabacteria bacterium]|nr:MFS transporter [Candidatus Dojkabacteria bacterium]MDQ7021403.1 MFS transporter [Candidatus Dojkabacteria bacterium]
MRKLLKKWEPLIIISLALFVVIIDTTIINVSITDVVKDLDTDIASMQWVITIYALIMAALLIVGGKLGDIYGRKRMFMIGKFTYGVGTFIASLSQNLFTLLIGWSILEGIGGALIMPASQALLTDNYKGSDRSIAFGVWGAIAGITVAFGPIAGGYLTANAS